MSRANYAVDSSTWEDLTIGSGVTSLSLSSGVGVLDSIFMISYSPLSST